MRHRFALRSRRRQGVSPPTLLPMVPLTAALLREWSNCGGLAFLCVKNSSWSFISEMLCKDIPASKIR